MLGPFGLSPKATMLRRAMPAAQALARRGHAVVVIMPPWHSPGEGGRAWSERVPGASVDLAVDMVAVDGPGIPGLYHGLVARRMVQSALRFRPDVVHAFKPKAYSGLADAFLHVRRAIGHARRPALVMDTDRGEDAEAEAGRIQGVQVLRAEAGFPGRGRAAYRQVDGPALRGHGQGMEHLARFAG